MKLNKRILDLIAANTGILTAIAGMSYNKDILQLIPAAWTPYITYVSGAATIILKLLAFFAPPTPSPDPTKEEKK